MELGGNAPFIVFDDADLESAIDLAVAIKYHFRSDMCSCKSFFYS